MPQTNSLPAAAYAVARGNLRLPRLQQVNPKFVTLLFDDQRAEQLFIEYFAGEPCPARAFYRALQDIRHAINDERKDGAR